jgi:UDP-N-acetylglucosamine--N-acetylmuramyl-(pentapeptide) pyrophosphoryl-undecaprenol N-acetylglucosamine transferase
MINDALESEKKIKILIAAGGTGGHLFPAVAIAEQFKKQLNEYVDIDFIGNPDRIESRIVPALGYNLRTININGYFGFSRKTLFLPLQIFRAIRNCRKLIREKKYNVVIAAGAYISYPPGIAAFKEGIPLVLMESNVNPGKTNRLLSGKASLIFTAFPESSKYYSKNNLKKLRPFGNPVRNFILTEKEKSESSKIFGLNPEKKTILFFGGSLGARSINRAVVNSLEKFKEMDLQILWQTGKNYIPPPDIPENVKVLQFIDDMASAYYSADLVVSRSGATTVAELGIVGKPSILVPYPSASNNEQEFNAKVLEDKNAAIIVPDNEIEFKLFDLISKYIFDDQKLASMSQNAKSLGKPDAAEECVREISNYLNLKTKK